MVRRATRLLIFLLKVTPLGTLTVRSMATQAFNQPSKYRHSFRTGPMNTQSIRRIHELIIECSSVRITNQNLTVKIVIVSRDAIEDANKYIPQPTFLSSLLWKVIKEKIPLMKSIRNKIMVIPAAVCIKADCFANDMFGWVWLHKISLMVKPIPFVYKLHWSPTTQLPRFFWLLFFPKRLTDSIESDIVWASDKQCKRSSNIVIKCCHQQSIRRANFEITSYFEMVTTAEVALHK